MYNTPYILHYVSGTNLPRFAYKRMMVVAQLQMNRYQLDLLSPSASKHSFVTRSVCNISNKIYSMLYVYMVRSGCEYGVACDMALLNSVGLERCDGYRK